MPNKFFDKRTKYSEIKSKIAVKYFVAWATFMVAQKHTTRLIYIDLFSGPGKYKDGNYSTPILIAKEIIKNEKFSENVLMVFNDKDKEIVEHLEREISDLEGYEKIKNTPIFYKEDTANLQEKFSNMSIYPAFSFVDPYGYGALSQELIDGLTKDWGCDCLFFFNYSALRRAVSNKKANHKRLETIFGKGKVKALADGLAKLGTSIERQKFMLKHLFDYSKEFSLNYFLPFTLVREQANRVHMLILVSKKFRAYGIMKDIMWKECNVQDNTYASFRYSATGHQDDLFSKKPEEELAEKLLKDFSGKIFNFKALYENSASIFEYFHYSEKCYKLALQKLENQGKIKIDGAQKGFFGSNIAYETTITFLDDGNGD